MVVFDSTELTRALSRQLRGRRSGLAQETGLHDAVAAALSELGIAYERELRLSGRDRLDFFLLESGMAIEVKKHTAGAAELRQIIRYLQSERVSSCMLIALRCNGIPASLLNKPIHTIELWRLLM